MAFVWWPETGRLVAPWPRHAPLWLDEEEKLGAVLDQLAELGPALRRPCWLFPDGRPPVAVEAPELARWLSMWAADRASYVQDVAQNEV